VLVFALRRAVASVLVLLAASFVTFVFAAETYDPLKPFRARNPRPPQAFFDAKIHQLHLDHGVLERYWDWLRHLVGFGHRFPFLELNLGTDVNGAPVATSVGQRLEVTTRMIVGAIVLAVLLAIVLGAVSGVRRGKPFDAVTTVFTFTLLALPTFWFAAVLKSAAIRVNESVGRSVFYTAGAESFGAPAPHTIFSVNSDQLRHLVLPVVSVGLLTSASWIRYQRAFVVDVLDADYLRLARAKGVRYWTVIRRHGLRNALIPLVTIMAVDIGALFGGAIITEKVYVWHGMGEYLNAAIRAEDANAVIGWVMVSAIFVVVFTLCADLLYGVLDPRIRQE
jgi:peptide/nickel transport system permease protein